MPQKKQRKARFSHFALPHLSTPNATTTEPSSPSCPDVLVLGHESGQFALSTVLFSLYYLSNSFLLSLSSLLLSSCCPCLRTCHISSESLRGIEAHLATLFRDWQGSLQWTFQLKSKCPITLDVTKVTKVTKVTEYRHYYGVLTP